ncbi:MAG: universal stress protein [Alphaproteobacteria bacterium]|nr:universal stress protein [Alphaproteobacteria bacterium]
MTFKTILVEVDSSRDAEKTVTAAASLAKRFKATLHGFHVMPDIAATAVGPAGDMVSPRLVEDMERDTEARAEAAEKLFRSVAGDLAGTDGWHLVGGMGSAVETAPTKVAHYADLVVIGGPESDTDTVPRVISPQDFVVDCGRPLLFNPEAAAEGAIGTRIVVAWTETAEAARATFDSLPFLETAETVTVVTVAEEDPDGPTPREKVATVLEAHGVKAAVDSVPPRKGKSTSETLFDYAEEAKADLLVAGAYSHTRLREGLFGGVTKSIFESAPLPVLLSH